MQFCPRGKLSPTLTQNLTSPGGQFSSGAIAWVPIFTCPTLYLQETYSSCFFYGSRTITFQENCPPTLNLILTPPRGQFSTRSITGYLFLHALNTIKMLTGKDLRLCSIAYFQKFDSNAGSKTFGKSGLWKFRKNGPHAKIHSIGNFGH